MKNIFAILILIPFFLAGCETLRFAPTETQKQNAWLHNRTAMAAAETARAEQTSQKLQDLIQLNELQSRSLISYYGLPQQFPQAETAQDILTESNFQLADTALAQSAQRVDTWQLADNVLELAIGVSALLGGVYGTRAVRFLKDARIKSNALKEVVQGNELFKKEHKAYANIFKQSHENQSTPTRHIVAQLKT